MIEPLATIVSPKPVKNPIQAVEALIEAKPPEFNGATIVTVTQENNVYYIHAWKSSKRVAFEVKS